jgi:hypothetical protein
MNLSPSSSVYAQVNELQTMLCWLKNPQLFFNLAELDVNQIDTRVKVLDAEEAILAEINYLLDYATFHEAFGTESPELDLTEYGDVYYE